MRFHELRPLMFGVAMASVACATSGKSGMGPAADPTRAAVSGSVPGQRASASSTANASRKRVDATCDWRTGDHAP